MSTLDIIIRTLQKIDYPISVAETATLKDLKTLASETLNIGVATTCVYKGAPLKDENATLVSYGIKSGDNIVTVFKKVAAVPATPAPAAAPSTPAAPVKPVVASGPAPTPIATASGLTGVASPISPPVVTTEKKTYEDWGCPACTFFNIGARSICEMCATPNPARPSTRYQAASGSNHAFDTTGMDEATMIAIQQALGDDMGDEDGEVAIDLDALLETAQTDDNVRKMLCTQFGLPDTSTPEEIRQAASTASHSMEDQQEMDPGLLLQLLTQDPEIRERLAGLLPNGNLDNITPEMLQTVLQSLMQDGGAGLFGDEDEDDMDMDIDDMGADPW